MIVIESRLESLFATLPLITVQGSDYQPAYNFGSHADLLIYLNNKRKEGGKVYPLIWLETPIEDTGKNNRVTTPLKLILATLSTTQLSNKERLILSFDTTLIPLYDNIYKALRMSGFTTILSPEDNKRTKYYNYGVEKTEATDIWDVIKFECKVEFTDCEQEVINY
jgi:hypothetical protein